MSNLTETTDYAHNVKVPAEKVYDCTALLQYVYPKVLI